jgi:hypothetical protein
MLAEGLGLSGIVSILFTGMVGTVWISSQASTMAISLGIIFVGFFLRL